MVDIVGTAADGVGSYAQLATGTFTGTGNQVNITIGFMPRHVVIYNKTDATKYEKIRGMLATETIKTVTGGGMTTDTGSLITFPTDAGLNEPGSAVVLAAAAAVTGKAFVFAIYG